MATIKSNHDAVLHIPGGPSINPGASVAVDNWPMIENNDVTKSWLAAKAIEIVDEKVESKSKKAD